MPSPFFRIVVSDTGEAVVLDGSKFSFGLVVWQARRRLYLEKYILTFSFCS